MSRIEEASTELGLAGVAEDLGRLREISASLSVVSEASRSCSNCRFYIWGLARDYTHAMLKPGRCRLYRKSKWPDRVCKKWGGLP